jgi:hypothetical protein
MDSQKAAKPAPEPSSRGRFSTSERRRSQDAASDVVPENVTWLWRSISAPAPIGPDRATWPRQIANHGIPCRNRDDKQAMGGWIAMGRTSFRQRMIKSMRFGLVWTRPGRLHQNLDIWCGEGAVD